MLEELRMDDDGQGGYRVLNRACPFCGRSKPPEEEDVEWWEPTECGHACCSDCAKQAHHPVTGEYEHYSLCPSCDREAPAEEQQGGPALAGTTEEARTAEAIRARVLHELFQEFQDRRGEAIATRPDLTPVAEFRLMAALELAQEKIVEEWTGHMSAAWWLEQDWSGIPQRVAEAARAAILEAAKSGGVMRLYEPESEAKAEPEDSA